MRRRHDDPAAGQVLPHQPGERVLSLAIEGRGWLVEQPQRPLGGQQAGYNDIGILTAPDGRSYSVAVMIKLTSVPLPVRMALMNNVVRAVITQHDMQYSAVAQR